MSEKSENEINKMRWKNEIKMTETEAFKKIQHNPWWDKKKHRRLGAENPHRDFEGDVAQKLLVVLGTTNKKGKISKGIPIKIFGIKMCAHH